ncbi:MAG: hypothetical protein IKH33_05540, partial [Bacteroidales bacterium]|nr:hypothetical protein [Bacteroidales bacterium]
REAKDKKGNRTGKEVVEVNLEHLFADSEAGKLKKKTTYERICIYINIYRYIDIKFLFEKMDTPK